MSKDVLAVLVICEGNICRSPLGAMLLNERLERESDIRIASAGLRAVVGASMDPQAARQAARHGTPDTSHVARLATESMLLEADLVLTMTVEQRTRAIQLAPLAMRRSFTLKELALAALSSETHDHSVAANMKELIALGNARRSTVQGEELDIQDPYRRGDSVHAAVADEINSAVSVIAQALATGPR